MSISGNTPMIGIRYRDNGEEKEIFAKLEYYNPTGSIKDRVAEYILKSAYDRGEIKKGQAIVETTSGNTGIAFAALGARYDHPVHIFMPSWASEERKNLMKMYGAVLHEVTREEGGFQGAILRAEELAKEIGAYLPHQFDNKDNVTAHYLTTGAEIVHDLPNVTDFVSGIGTGGTLMGVAKALQEHANVKITALEPDALPLLSKGIAKGEHKIEGIGDDFIPSIVNMGVIDNIVDINDEDAIVMSSRLANELGLGVGISSGANFLAAILANTQGRIVSTVFADDNKKYLSTTLKTPKQMTSNMISSRIELIDYRSI